jgi:hypothetical protein
MHRWEDNNKMDKFKRVLTMLYHNQNCRVFGLSSMSGILGNTKHDVLENESVSIHRCGGEDT